MAPTPGTYSVGSDTGHLYLRTSREGVASRAGHDLLIAVRQWSGTVGIDAATGPDGLKVTIKVEVDMSSLDIVEGTGGIAPLSAHDRAEISKTARKLLDVDHFPMAVFVSTLTTSTASRGTIDGTATIRGQSAPASLDVTGDGDTSWECHATIRQSDFGIKPYRAFFGALRLADPIGVEIAVTLRSD